jgi:hypothetical protein
MRKIRKHRGLNSGHDFVCRRSYHNEIKDSIICGVIYRLVRYDRCFLFNLMISANRVHFG